MLLADALLTAVEPDEMTVLIYVRDHDLHTVRLLAESLIYEVNPPPPEENQDMAEPIRFCLARELGWPLGRTMEALDRLSARGLLRRCEPDVYQEPQEPGEQHGRIIHEPLAYYRDFVSLEGVGIESISW